MNGGRLYKTGISDAVSTGQSVYTQPMQKSPGTGNLIARFDQNSKLTDRKPKSIQEQRKLAGHTPAHDLTRYRGFEFGGQGLAPGARAWRGWYVVV